MASFFKDLGLALAPKVRPDQSQTFKEVNNRQVFTVRRKNDAFFFLGQPLFWMLRGMFVQWFAQIFEELTAQDQYCLLYTSPSPRD